MSSGSTNGQAQPVLRFRNYRPQEETLKAAAPSSSAAAPTSSSSSSSETKAAAAPAIKFEPLKAAPSAALEAKIKEEEFAKPAVAAPVSATAETDDNAITIAPRKPNWDLKRDLQPKLKALERQTDRAIAELVRRNIAARQQELQQGGGAGAASSSSSSDGEPQLSDAAVAAILSAEPEKMGASWGGAEEIDLE